MKKFQFRLEAVERHRKLQEQEKQVWLAKQLERMKATEAKLFELDKKEVKARREFSGLGNPNQKEPVTSAKFWLLDQFIIGQKTRRVDLKQQLESEEAEVRLAYRDFLHARQQRKIMEKLREKRFSQFKEDFKRQEARLMDEQYVTRSQQVDGELLRDEEEESEN